MSVPGRQVNSKPDAHFFCSVRNLADDVAVSVFVRAGSNGVGGVLGRPVAEAVRVLKVGESQSLMICEDLDLLLCSSVEKVEGGCVQERAGRSVPGLSICNHQDAASEKRVISNLKSTSPEQVYHLKKAEKSYCCGNSQGSGITK